MSTASLAFAALALICYVEAGRRNLQTLFFAASDADRRDELLWQAVQANAVPWTFKLTYVVLWAPIGALAWLMSRRARHD